MSEKVYTQEQLEEAKAQEFENGKAQAKAEFDKDAEVSASKTEIEELKQENESLKEQVTKAEEAKNKAEEELTKLKEEQEKNTLVASRLEELENDGISLPDEQVKSVGKQIRNMSDEDFAAYKETLKSFASSSEEEEEDEDKAESKSEASKKEKKESKENGKDMVETSFVIPTIPDLSQATVDRLSALDEGLKGLTSKQTS